MFGAKKRIAELEEYCAELEEKLAKSGNKYYLQDAKRWTSLYDSKCQELATVKADITKLIRENAGLTEENIRLTKRIGQYEQIMRPKQEIPRDRSGRFSGGDMSKEEKCRVAYTMREANYPDTQIAQELGISLESVRKYAGIYERQQEKQPKIIRMGDEQAAN